MRFSESKYADLGRSSAAKGEGRCGYSGSCRDNVLYQKDPLAHDPSRTLTLKYRFEISKPLIVCA
jgi:hypothetical protein